VYFLRRCVFLFFFSFYPFPVYISANRRVHRLIGLVIVSYMTSSTTQECAFTRVPLDDDCWLCIVADAAAAATRTRQSTSHRRLFLIWTRLPSISLVRAYLC